jgi:hypothetical protein
MITPCSGEFWSVHRMHEDMLNAVPVQSLRYYFFGDLYDCEYLPTCHEWYNRRRTCLAGQAYVPGLTVGLVYTTDVRPI